ncbi:phosphoenolpyruvate--protein phosphotransferase [Caproiciproducens sp. CPB-2]|uniref:phosphoenolpyruvate--protein phosphotransferase n=1 Tax=Caproiciproducens sp. CPB-2 TaxID=3030017 RepID=UPI0023DBA2E1|nr:phosphoenolpyruvate--protein phosphotransferase [Caproiciproducens sp. CPB-2]MDF1494536.1 phosphoenolpyruvate--protein phosphotransferase [Caproiciproducens sp. CPB-2]
MMYKGNPVSEGIAVGETFHYIPFVPTIVPGKLVHGKTDTALQKYETARAAAKAELETVVGNLSRNDSQKAKIFQAHLDILFDAVMGGEIRDEICTQHSAPDWAIEKTYEKYICCIGQSGDQLIRERTADLRDVKNRLLRCMQGLPEQNLSTLERPIILVTHDLLPSDTATLDRERVLAIVTEVGGSTSHSAIIARSYKIPALLGMENAMALLPSGKTIIVDAVEGQVITSPSAEEIAFYEREKTEFAVKIEKVRTYLTAQPVTADGIAVKVELNIESADAQELEGGRYTDGVGLFRTEFLYMGKDRLPTEEEQLAVYKKVLTEFGRRPVVIRTLDIGGDKKLECLNLPQEENPSLGNRALRLCLQKPEIFLTQLRACLRASVYGNLWLMFPMISSMDDIHRAKDMLESAKARLDKQGFAYSPDIKIGIMVEIPSIALIADMAAKEVDFASIGTNDLTQYATAVDRMNPAVHEYYQPYHPALFRLIGYVAEQFEKYNKPVGVCGELAGDKLGASVLIGLGIRRLSMGSASIAQTKKLICHLTLEKAHILAEAGRMLPNSEAVKFYLQEQLKDIL